MKPSHKHCELIKAWADGAEIEVKGIYAWNKTDLPVWLNDDEYRINPEPKPDAVEFHSISQRGVISYGQKNLKATFNDGKLIKAEVI